MRRVLLTGITLASNLGTFVLYALICGLTFVAFIGQASFRLQACTDVPVLGLALNVLMVLAIFILGILAGGTTSQATYLALGIGLGWLILSVAYFIITSLRKGKAILPPVSALAVKPAPEE